MHHVIMQVNEGPELQLFLEFLTALGVSRVVFPPCEYRSERAGRGNDRKSMYETARLWPRGDDGGYAERFLNDRRSS